MCENKRQQRVFDGLDYLEFPCESIACIIHIINGRYTHTNMCARIIIQVRPNGIFFPEHDT